MPGVVVGDTALHQRHDVGVGLDSPSCGMKRCGCCRCIALGARCAALTDARLRLPRAPMRRAPPRAHPPAARSLGRAAPPTAATRGHVHLRRTSCATWQRRSPAVAASARAFRRSELNDGSLPPPPPPPPLPPPPCRRPCRRPAAAAHRRRRPCRRPCRHRAPQPLPPRPSRAAARRARTPPQPSRSRPSRRCHQSGAQLHEPLHLEDARAPCVRAPTGLFALEPANVQRVAVPAHQLAGAAYRRGRGKLRLAQRRRRPSASDGRCTRRLLPHDAALDIVMDLIRDDRAEAVEVLVAAVGGPTTPVTAPANAAIVSSLGAPGGGGGEGLDHRRPWRACSAGSGGADDELARRAGRRANLDVAREQRDARVEAALREPVLELVVLLVGERLDRRRVNCLLASAEGLKDRLQRDGRLARARRRHREDVVRRAHDDAQRARLEVIDRIAGTGHLLHGGEPSAANTLPLPPPPPPLPPLG